MYPNQGSAESIVTLNVSDMGYSGASDEELVGLSATHNVEPGVSERCSATSRER